MNREMAVCAAPGCGGILTFSTDAIGRTVERCPKCSARKTVARDAAPAPSAPPAAANGKAARSWDNCERTFTSQGWLDRHVKTCGKPASAPKQRATPPAARSAPPAPPTPPAPGAMAPAKRYPITLGTIKSAAQFVGIPDAQAGRLVELVRFLGTLEPAEVA